MSGAPAPVAAVEVELLADRVWRQVRDGIDADRLLPSADKRRKQLLKAIDKPLDVNGWAKFVSAQAHGILNGKAPGRRNAERMLVETIARWTCRRDRAGAPERLPALRLIVDYGLAHPAALPPKEADK